MTYTIKTEQINNISISITQDKFSSAYDVTAVEVHDNGLGYVLNENTYPTIEKARKRFSYLKSLAKKGKLQ